ncbi:MAG: tRNA pseudouridine(55) synthase TruB, partial [Gammaproteobacteria bacterium]|nr:tRNA pseudouridine(55) synthase TruB [Gammaproteobacteria bacterium]
CQGQAVFVPQAPSSGWVKLFATPQRFLGVGEVQDDGRIAPRRLLNLT